VRSKFWLGGLFPQLKFSVPGQVIADLFNDLWYHGLHVWSKSLALAFVDRLDVDDDDVTGQLAEVGGDD
jgi:hypothetical protein